MTSSGERELLRTYEGVNGKVSLYQVIPEGHGLGDLEYEVVSFSSRQSFRAMGQAVTVAEELAGAPKEQP